MEAHQNKFKTLVSRPEAGMFSVFSDVLILLDHYEKGVYLGVTVNFNRQGVYYDSSHGLNWWTYYCRPIKLGKKLFFAAKQIHFGGNLKKYGISKARAAALTKKYIHPKETIQKAVKEFIELYFADAFVIGVHYRGTDKQTEAELLPYEKVADAIEKEILNHQGSCKIFVATDEEPFLKYVNQRFPGQILCLNAIRSEDGKPIHLASKQPYQQGLEAMMDCLLLSHTHLLIRTASNLSLWSTFFNPNLPVIQLTSSIYGEPFHFHSSD